MHTRLQQQHIQHLPRNCHVAPVSQSRSGVEYHTWAVSRTRPGKSPADKVPYTCVPPPAGNAGTWMDTSCLVTNVRNFPSARGHAVGLLKSFLGLSASLYTAVYVALLAPHVEDFLLLLALAPTMLVRSAACRLGPAGCVLGGWCWCWCW